MTGTPIDALALRSRRAIRKIEDAYATNLVGSPIFGVLVSPPRELEDRVIVAGERVPGIDRNGSEVVAWAVRWREGLHRIAQVECLGAGNGTKDLLEVLPTEADRVAFDVEALAEDVQARGAGGAVRGVSVYLRGPWLVAEDSRYRPRRPVIHRVPSYLACAPYLLSLHVIHGGPTR